MVRLPASNILLSLASTDAKNNEFLFDTDEISITFPLVGLSGYPSGTAYLHTVAFA